MKCMKRKQIVSVCIALFYSSCFAFPMLAQATVAKAGLSAKEISSEAIKQGSVQEAIEYLKKQIPNSATNADKRSLLFFTGTIQEQLGQYEDASYSYAQAAGIAAGDAEGMQKVSSEQLVLDAVRTSLCAGDYETADRYLNSAVRSSKDEKILAYINLYAQWSALCKAQSIDETKDAVSLLKAYATMDSMRPVEPAVLLTLWYITGDDEYSKSIQKEFPSSPEAGVVTGKVQIMSVPFWYFVPHAGGDNIAIADESVAITNEVPADDAKQKPAATDSTDSSDTEKITREQCGLFREEPNAKALVDQLKKKGFDAKITSEKRASGTTYFIVVVDENKEGTIGLKLRDAGFECYPVVE